VKSRRKNAPGYFRSRRKTPFSPGTYPAPDAWYVPSAHIRPFIQAIGPERARQVLRRLKSIHFPAPRYLDLAVYSVENHGRWHPRDMPQIRAAYPEVGIALAHIKNGKRDRRSVKLRQMLRSRDPDIVAQGMELLSILRSNPPRRNPRRNSGGRYIIEGVTDERDSCDCCGKTNLKRTVVLRTPDGEHVYFGTSCAARAMKTTVKAVRQGITSANRKKAEATRKARAAQSQKELARWTRHLVQRTGGIKDYRGQWDVFAMIERLGGYAAAKKGYK
jgi:hypothetical protein